MDILQKRLFHKAKFKSALMQMKRRSAKRKEVNSQGFMIVFLMPLMTLIITGMAGLFSLSMGIKTITKAQSYCMQANLKGQKQLGVLLNKILKLNDKARSLHNTRKSLSASINTAVGLGQLQLALFLKKKLKFIKMAQNIVIIKQKSLLAKSFLIKKQILLDFKKSIRKIKKLYARETTFHKKALALKKQKIGDRAYVYKPVPDFINQQKTSLEWSIQPFFPLSKNLKWILPEKAKGFSVYSCTASLKHKEGKWISQLYH